MATALPTHAGPFALGTFAVAGREFAGLVVGERVRDLSDLTGGSPATVSGLVTHWDAVFPILTGLAGSATGMWTPLDEVVFRPPLRPGQVLQSGANYRRHVVDLVMAEYHAARAAGTDDRPEDEARAEGEAMMDARAANGRPYVFIGLPSAMCGAYDEVVLPALGVEHDWELELAVVIGRTARNVTREAALNHVAGYTICNDITTRDQLYRSDLKKIGTDWLAAKNSPTFLPTGPFLMPAPFVGDPMDLRITLRHNGEMRQDESTKDMIFDIPALISYTSRIVELRPGDLLLTGSPAGNGAHWQTYLRAGDVLESGITGLGGQRNVCVAET
jgi:2-keto-4-pentenoate hydratase/2-oxohepta-3-ene-1,7-dioic acid hydratase in catechol pathway